MNQYKQPPKLLGYNFDIEDIYLARNNNKLLSIRIETSRFCNLKCIYCNSDSGKPINNEISFHQIQNIIKEASELGAKSIIIIGGGEPTIYQYFRELVRYINALKLVPVIFTNGIAITEDLAGFLYKNNVSVIAKLDSFKEETQDFLSGEYGSYKKILSGIEKLKNVGYCDDTKGDLRLGISFVTTKINLEGCLNIWKYCRNNRIYPNQEFLVPNGRAINILDLIPSNEEIRKLKNELLEIDRKDYNIDWLPYKPLTGSGCLQMFYNLYIDVIGNIRPCAAIQNDIININHFSLKEAINHPFIQFARNIDKYLEGKCSKCEFIKECIGCRGNAYTIGKLNGKDDYSALKGEDPFCFKDE